MDFVKLVTPCFNRTVVWNTMRLEEGTKGYEVTRNWFDLQSDSYYWTLGMGKGQKRTLEFVNYRLQSRVWTPDP